MPNNYFQFKQFRIEQDKCAMKVCTDACLFGAIIANTLVNKNKVLDIGAGTGLLSIMYAQKNTNCTIDAVEIDSDAYEQALQNIDNCEWKDRINLHHQPIQEYSKNIIEHYDFILSNPPFFENQLKSESEQRNKALHSSALSLQELAGTTKKLLKNDGVFAVLLPYYRKEYFKELAEKEGMFFIKEYLIKQTDKHEFFRVVLIFSKLQESMKTENIIIKENESYSLRFRELLKDYYLYL
ncbi:MAG: methyltransferase [Arachidicoccus sp.]|nr:methyltransferase [Arachidicoccus sp.]